MICRRGTVQTEVSMNLDSKQRFLLVAVGLREVSEGKKNEYKIKNAYKKIR